MVTIKFGCSVSRFYKVRSVQSSGVRFHDFIKFGLLILYYEAFFVERRVKFGNLGVKFGIVRFANRTLSSSILMQERGIQWHLTI